MQLIYFIQSDSERPIKIGYTQNLSRRFEHIQSCNPEALRLLGVIEGTRELEFRLHRRFAELHVRGEWFKPDPILIEYIQSLPTDMVKKFNEELRQWLTKKNKTMIGKEIKVICCVCNRKVDESLRKGRCSVCSTYFRNHGHERPIHLIENQFPKCSNCACEYDWLIKTECPTCYDYRHKKGIAKPIPSDHVGYKLKQCSVCNRNTFQLTKELCVACYSYTRKHGVPRPAHLLSRKSRNQKQSGLSD